MEYREWFDKKKEIIKGNIESKMSDAYATHAANTGGRPSSATYGISLNEGYISLREGIQTLLNEAFEMFPITKENIEIFKKEAFQILQDGIKFINSKYSSSYVSSNSRDVITGLEMDITKMIETQKKKLKENKKLSRKEIILFALSFLVSIAALAVSIISLFIR